MMVDDIDVGWIGYHQGVVDVIRLTALATTPSDIDDGYFEWYYRVSHLVSPHHDVLREVAVPVYEAGPFDPS